MSQGQKAYKSHLEAPLLTKESSEYNGCLYLAISCVFDDVSKYICKGVTHNIWEICVKFLGIIPTRQKYSLSAYASHFLSHERLYSEWFRKFRPTFTKCRVISAISRTLYHHQNHCRAGGGLFRLVLPLLRWLYRGNVVRRCAASRGVSRQSSFEARISRSCRSVAPRRK